MSISPSVNDVRTGKYAIPLFFALIAAGLAGNYFKLQILNLHFTFGSIFAMLALQIFGPGRGDSGRCHYLQLHLSGLEPPL